MRPVIKSSLALTWARVFLITYVPNQSSGTPIGNLQSRLSVYAEPHIINGKYTSIEDVPYQIAIEKLTILSCGGVIISDSWALTAAHCVHSDTSGKYTNRIRVGTSIEIPLIGWGGSIHHIEEIICHHDFNIRILDYDVALLKVTKKFEFGSRVQPIQMPSQGPIFIDYTSTATISGWGKTQVGAWFPAFRLRSADVKIMSADKCREHLSMSAYFLSKRVICGLDTEGSASYYGDSGGPLVQKGKLIGIISWGIKDIDGEAPSVYSNVLQESIRTFIANRTGF